MPTSDHHDIMLYRELGTSCVGPAIYIYEKIKFESQRSLGFAGHPAIETRCITAVGSFKFEFFKILSAESICLKLSFRLHVVAWQPDNGKYVRLKSRVRLNIRVQGVMSKVRNEQNLDSHTRKMSLEKNSENFQNICTP